MRNNSLYNQRFLKEYFNDKQIKQINNLQLKNNLIDIDKIIKITNIDLPSSNCSISNYQKAYELGYQLLKNKTANELRIINFGIYKKSMQHLARKYAKHFAINILLPKKFNIKEINKVKDKNKVISNLSKQLKLDKHIIKKQFKKQGLLK